MENHSENRQTPAKKNWLRWLIPAIVLVLIIVIAVAMNPGKAEAPAETTAPVTAAVETEAPETPETEAPETVPVVSPEDADLVLRNFDTRGTSVQVFGTDISKRTICSIEFLNSLETAPETAYDVSETGNGRILLWTEPAEEDTQKLFIAGDGKVIFPANSAFLFGKSGNPYIKATSIAFNGAVDTSFVTNMCGMFHGCSSLETLDLTGFETRCVKDMRDMFVGCRSLTTLDFTGCSFDSSANMSSMFYGCEVLTAAGLKTDSEAVRQQLPAQE